MNFWKIKQMKILIRAANWVGDAIMTTPVIRAVRRHYPSAHITLLAKPWVIPVFHHNPNIDTILLYDDGGRHTRGWGTIRLARDLRRHGFDMAILMQNAFEAALITFLAGIPRRIGYNTDGRTLLLNPSIKMDKALKKGHLVDYYRGILKGASITDHGPDLDIFITQEERLNALKILDSHGIVSGVVTGTLPDAVPGTLPDAVPARQGDGRDEGDGKDVGKPPHIGINHGGKTPLTGINHGEKPPLTGINHGKKPPLIGINPGATGGTAKRWFPHRYGELAKQLHEYLKEQYGDGKELYGDGKEIDGTKLYEDGKEMHGDEKSPHRVQKPARGDHASRILIFGGPGEAELGDRINRLSGDVCINLAGMTTLREAFALIQLCDLFITNDSGLMHGAAALGTPLIAIIGSTDPGATGPTGERSKVVRTEVPCTPCLKKHCPGDHLCMELVSVDMVMEAAVGMLKGMYGFPDNGGGSPQLRETQL
ncbi:MAG: hypothetical protein HQK66_13635 [Desulfamplus sp.]|nr:hypothetical protein [Desulfamplus sp.]